MSINDEQLQSIIEGALIASGRPLSILQLKQLFTEEEQPDTKAIRTTLIAIANHCQGRGFTLQEVASGFRFQAVESVAPWISRLWEEKPPKYSRALLETLALIAYRQPVTRGDIENVRGVAVSSPIIRTLLEREWVRVVGYKEVPGRPALFATTRHFLDYFNLKSLEELPKLAPIQSTTSLHNQDSTTPTS